MTISEFPIKVIKVIGLAQQGYTSAAEIGLLANLHTKTVVDVLESTDTRIRAALRDGLDSDTAKIDIPIKCTGCHMVIDRVPCVLCRCKEAQRGR